MLAALHSDLIFINFFPSKLAYNGIIDIYRYIFENFGGDKIVWSYYPPLTYLVLGAFQFIFKPLEGGFYNWIQQVYSSGCDKWLIANGVSFDFFKYLFLMKLPYAAFDCLCIIVMMKFVDEKRQKMNALKLWSFSPVLLYGVYMFGQIDIMPASLALVSVLLFKEKRNRWGFFLLSMAALFKTYTIFLILPFLVMFSRSWRDLAKNLAAAAVPFIFILLPYYISSRGYVINSIFPRFYVADVTAGSWQYVQKAIFLGLYLFLLFACHKSARKGEGMPVLVVSISTLMILYTLFFVPVHYFIWVTPFLILAVCLKFVPAWLYYFQMLCLFTYSLNGAGTTTGLLAPLNPGFFLGLPGLPDMFHQLNIRWGMVMLSARLVFTAICVLVAMELIGGLKCRILK